MKGSRFLKACRRERTDRTPIWLMRQAGRYQKKFRDIRAKVGFLELCKNSPLAAEVTVMAVEDLAVDAAIIFADILLPLDALGVGLHYEKGEGPVIDHPFRTTDDITALSSADVVAGLNYVFESIKIARAELEDDVPLLGFAGCPFTLASYLIEGGSSRHFERTKTMMYSRPEVFHKLMQRLSEITVKYASEQIKAGADAIQLFDSWVGCLSVSDYETFVAPHSRSVFAGLSGLAPVIHFGTGTAALLPLLKQAGGDVIGLDWRVDLKAAWAGLGHDVAVQGNLDPSVLLGDKSEIKRQSLRVLSEAEGRNGHIFNLGHGVLPTTPEDNVRYLVEIVKEHGGRR